MTVRGGLTGFGLAPTDVPGVRPGGRPTFLHAQESRQRKRPCKTAPAGFPALLESQGRAELASLRSAQTSVASQCLKRTAHAPWDSSITGGFEGETRNTPPQQPTAKPASRLAPAVLHSPLEPAEERRTSSPFAQRTSKTDSRRLFEQSVAARVRRAGLKSDAVRQDRAQHLRAVRRLTNALPHASGRARRAARCEAKGRADRGRRFAFFLVAQKEGRPPGRIPGWASRGNPQQREGLTP
jgi:hypothetical protein